MPRERLESHPQRWLKIGTRLSVRGDVIVRLVLRRFTQDNADILFDVLSDPDVMRFLSGGAPTPRSVIETDILPRFLRHDECFPAFGFWVAIERTSGDFVGWFSFRPTAEAVRREVNLGFRLPKASWGKGYATEGARAPVRWGFTKLGVQRVVATTDENNSASRCVTEKAAMTLTRTSRITALDLNRVDTYHVTSQDLWGGDNVAYSLQRADWEGQGSAAPFGKKVNPPGLPKRLDCVEGPLWAVIPRLWSQ